MHTRALSLIIGLGVALAPLSSATAFELFGVKFFESEADADAVIADPRDYEITFETEGSEDLEPILRGASNLWREREDPASGVAGLLAKARGDYRRLTGALYNEGYYGPVISIQVNGRQASDIAPDATLPDPITVAVRVDPGPEFHFGRLEIANRPPTPLPEGDEVDSPEDLGFRMGNVARAGIVTQAEQALVAAWRQLGYAKAEIAGREVGADHPSNTLEVAIRVNPGRRAAIGPVAVSGTENMDPAFVARQTGLNQGEEYDPDTIEKARDRLSRLEVFRSLRVEAAEAIQPDGLLPFNVIVQEQALRRFGIGATLSNVDGLGVEGFWLHRNLFGQAERLRLDAKVAGIGFPVETEEFDYAFGGTFTKPGIFTPDTDLVASLKAERATLENYTEISAGGRLGLTHMLSDEITLEGSSFVERSRFEDDFGTRDFLTAGVTGTATFDSRDSNTDPTEGLYLAASVEPGYEFNYGNPLVGTMAEGRTYFGFGEDDKVVLAARVKAAALAGPSLSEIPPDRLFFAGGGGSVRGYPYRSIGVEAEDGTTTGGRYLLEGSLEARVRINDSFGAVGFVDGGYVAADTFPGIEDLRVGAGVGVRYYTGLGPLRLDLAVPLNKRDGDPDYAFYVGIGQAF